MEDQRGKEKTMAGEEVIAVAAGEETAEMTERKEGEKSSGESDQENTPATVCKFFLEGRCRFGEGCLNRHEGSPKMEAKEKAKGSKEERRRRKKEKKEAEEERHSKLPSMKTAADVISRLQWDKQLPVDKFTVGYIDRSKHSQLIFIYDFDQIPDNGDFQVPRCSRTAFHSILLGRPRLC